MIECAADQTRTDDPLVNSQLNSNAEPHLNLLYHAELQRRIIQQIQAQNKCYARLDIVPNEHAKFFRKKFRLKRSIFQNSNSERYKGPDRAKFPFLLNIYTRHQEKPFGLSLSSLLTALYWQQSETHPPNLDLARSHPHQRR